MIKADIGYMAQLLSDAESDANALIDENLQIRVDLAQAKDLPFVVLHKPWGESPSETRRLLA